MNTRVGIFLSSLAMLSLTACSSSSSLDIQEGWDWGVRSAASYDLDADFNSYTGELAASTEDASTGLSLKGASPEPDAMQVAVDQAKQDICERYVDPYGDDPLQDQGLQISTLLSNTVDAAIAPEYSNEYIDADEAVSIWVKENSTDPFSYDIGSDEYTAAWAGRSDMTTSRFASEYPDLIDTRDAINKQYRELSQASWTADMVRAGQDQYIKACDLEVAADYEYPTPAELGLTVAP